VVFVPGGIPGDRLKVRLTESRARYGRAVIEDIEQPSADRVSAPCPYFGRCGGCRLQHVSYAAQLAFKEKQVRDCLDRLGGLGPSIVVRPILPAPDVLGYRNKMEFTVAGTAGAAIVGLHQADRYDVVLDIDRCLLQSDVMNTLLSEVRHEARERRLSVWEARGREDGEGLLRFITLREGRNTGEAMVNIVASAPDVAGLAPVASSLSSSIPGVTVLLNVNDKRASVAVGSEEHVLVGRDHIRESLHGVTFQVSANSFFQTNTRQAERLFEIVTDACELTGKETLVDRYSGTGAISLLLARRCARFYGIELVAAAVADAERNARLNGIENCTFLCGEVRLVLPALMQEGVRPDIVAADPPRAGFHPKALATLATLAPGRIVYVSCNPSTLARDLGDLGRSGYRVDWVQPVDMFPKTPHIEAVARLSRA